MAFNPFPLSEESNKPANKRHLDPGRSPFSSRENSPVPDRLATLQQDSPKRGPSPCLPRRTLEELESEEIRRKEGDIDPDDPPLRNPWTFWFERAPVPGGSSAAEDYSQALKNIYTVHTIKQFFSVYNNLKSPTYLNPKECYHLMRTNEKEQSRKPLWEDPDNLNGGIWVFKCKKEMTQNVWLDLLLAAIGEQFQDCTAEGDQVVGVSIKIRDYDTDTLQIWNENASHYQSAKVMDRVRQVISRMEIRDVFYSSIKDKISGNRSSYQPSVPSSQYRQSPPPPISSSAHPPRPSFNQQFTSSYRHPAPFRGVTSASYRSRGPDSFHNQAPGAATRYPAPVGGSGGRFPTPQFH